MAEKIVKLKPGRPKGTGKFGTETKPVRIPTAMLEDVYRFIESKGHKYPLYSTLVSAGYPSPAADDHVDRSFSLDEYLVPNPGATFFLKVDGEYMRDAGIFSGDIVIVDRSLEPRNKKIVVAAVEGGLTVKRLIKESEGIVLMPENPEFKPLWFRKGHDDVHIWGVVVGVLKRFG